MINSNSSRDAFGAFSRYVSTFAASPAATLLAFGMVLAWLGFAVRNGFTGDLLLSLNTTTTVVTFLMVFVLNNTQARDTSAINAKLDALIVALESADNRMVGLEHLGETEAKAVHEEVTESARGDDLAAAAPPVGD